MTGRITALHVDGGDILSETDAECTYHFARDAFFGNWEALVAAVAKGTVRVRFQRSGEGIAKTVVRLQP